MVYRNATYVVTADEIAFAGACPAWRSVMAADEAILRPFGNKDAVSAVAYIRGASDIRADVVTADGVAHRPTVLDAHTVVAIAADEITLARANTAWRPVNPANQVLTGSIVQINSVITV